VDGHRLGPPGPRRAGTRRPWRVHPSRPGGCSPLGGPESAPRPRGSRPGREGKMNHGGPWVFPPGEPRWRNGGEGAGSSDEVSLPASIHRERGRKPPATGPSGRFPPPGSPFGAAFPATEGPRPCAGPPYPGPSEAPRRREDTPGDQPSRHRGGPNGHRSRPDRAGKTEQAAAGGNTR